MEPLRREPRSLSMTQAEFNEQWSLEDIPGCDEAMEMLKRMHDLGSSAGIQAEVAEVKEIRERYRVHRNTCPKCNEV